jgi:hypothetical protein
MYCFCTARLPIRANSAISADVVGAQREPPQAGQETWARIEAIWAKRSPLIYYPFLLSTLTKTHKNCQNALKILIDATEPKFHQHTYLSIF